MTMRWASRALPPTLVAITSREGQGCRIAAAVAPLIEAGKAEGVLRDDRWDAERVSERRA